VAALSDYLSQDNHLFQLFTPSPSTRALFRTVTSLFGRPRFQPAWLAKWCGLVGAYPVASAIGALPGAAFAWTIADAHVTGWRLPATALLAVATIVAGITLGSAIALARDALRRIDGNFFGLVTGMDASDPQNPSALSVWLEQELEQTAGLEIGTPLTFGMLWDAKRDPRLEGLDAIPADPDVNLEMITTNVSWGRPHKFPLDTSRFGFVPRDFSAFFPQHIVAWMIAHSRDVAAREVPLDHDQPIAFPKMADVPVIVTTRLSLSYPVLLSAMPVYAVQGEGGAYERCWFSDGGMSIGFPITMFDVPLPRRPTFGIDLTNLPYGQTLSDDESKNIFMPPNNKALPPTWTPIATVGAFLARVRSTTQDWNDNTQIVLPGYRDRIVTVYLAPSEGGLNLDMPPQLLQRLRKRGTAAGAEIVARFAAPSVLTDGPTEMNWENHRWLRYRTTMAALRSYLGAFRTALEKPEKPDVPYVEFLRANSGVPTKEYPLEDSERADVIKLTEDLRAAGATIAALTTLADHVPQPPPQLDLRSRVDGGGV
jgi:hypothetical protein